MLKKSWPGKGLGEQLSRQKEQLVKDLEERAWHGGRLSVGSRMEKTVSSKREPGRGK